MSSLYNQEQIKDSITGYLWYDAPWGIIRAVYPFLGDSLLDIGSGSGVMAKVFKALKDAEKKPFSYTCYEGDYNDCDYYGDTVFTSHVLEHLEDPEGLIYNSMLKSGKNIIHIVPDGDVQDRNLGTPHKHIFNRQNFIWLFNKIERTNRIKRIHYGPIKGDRMDSLMYVGEVVKA